VVSFSLLSLLLHENEYSATLGERKKAPTNIWVNYHYQWRKRSFNGCFSAFLCFSLLFSAFLCGFKKNLHITIFYSFAARILYLPCLSYSFTLLLFYSFTLLLFYSFTLLLFVKSYFQSRLLF
jgi:hypothetical protein